MGETQLWSFHLLSCILQLTNLFVELHLLLSCIKALTQVEVENLIYFLFYHILYNSLQSRPRCRALAPLPYHSPI